MISRWFAWLKSPRFWGAVGYTFLTGLVVLVLLILATTIYLVYFNEPSVKVTNLDGKRLLSPLCPGQIIDVHSRITVEHPLLLFSYFSVMDTGLNHNYNGTQISNGPRPHPHAAAFTQTLTWMVPDLAPGVYSRVLTFRGTDGRENSIFVSTEFEIGEDCP